MEYHIKAKKYCYSVKLRLDVIFCGKAHGSQLVEVLLTNHQSNKIFIQPDSNLWLFNLQNFDVRALQHQWLFTSDMMASATALPCTLYLHPHIFCCSMSCVTHHIRFVYCNLWFYHNIHYVPRLPCGKLTTTYTMYLSYHVESWVSCWWKVEK